MKTINNILTVLVSALILSACSDLLDLEPRAQYTEMDVWGSVDNTCLCVNGFYRPIYEYGPYGVKYAGVSLTDGSSDILRYDANVMGGSGGDVNKVVCTGGISPQGNPLSDYTYEYSRIRRISEFLYGLKTCAKYGDQEKLIMETQARLFRAYLYFMLVKGHGSAVIRDNIDGPNEAFKERSPESTCWDLIESDFDFAVENLPDTWPKKDLGRITKGAVYGFKSRAMLYARRWEKAADATAKVVAEEGEPYDLMPNHAGIFDQSDSCRETVLGYRFHGQLTHSTLFDKQYSPKGDFPETDTDGKCLAVPTQELVDSYRMADGSSFDWNNPTHAANPYKNREPHFYASILYNGATWKGRTIETFMGGKDGFKPFDTGAYPNATTAGYCIRKLLNESIKGMTVKGTTCWNEVRYAGVPLNQAEALNEIGETAEALIPLDKVRSRAKLPAVSSTSQESLRSITREERKIELASEGQRYWGLRR